MAQALISVVIPLFNHESFIAQTIESVIAQDYRPVELIVVDDGSTDRSYAVAKAYERSQAGLSIHVYRQTNRGVAAAFNFGIQKSRGVLIAGIASDDYYLPGALGSSAAVLTSSAASRVALVHSIVYLLDARGRLISMEGEHLPASGRCLHGLLTRDAGVWAPTMMFTREAYDAVGGIDEALEAEDYDFFARLAAHGFEFAFNPRHTVVKRIMPASLGADTMRWYATPFRTLEKHRAVLAPQEYRDIRMRLHLYVIRLAAGGGNRTALRVALSRLRGETGDLRILAKAYRSIIHYRILNLLPFRVRAILRELRRHSRGAIPTAKSSG